MRGKESKTKTVELTERECAQIRASILLSLWDDKMRYMKQTADGDPSYELKARLDYYDELMKRFEWR